MTLLEFQALPYERQPEAVFDTGTYLVRRYEEEAAVHLYHAAGGFFVVLCYDPRANDIVRLRAFSRSAPLEDYAAYITLPPG